MYQEEQTIVYKGYARKSSEAEDKQVLSIESQVADSLKFPYLSDKKITSENFFTEEKSAKTPHGRPVFEELIKEIENGKVRGVIAWHPNRLSRNPIDAARLVDLMDREKLVEIVTQQQVFRNTPNDKFIFALMCLQAKMENDNKSIDVKRGLRNKYEKGYLPGVAKVGYKNDYGIKGERKIMEDPERFKLTKQLFNKFLSGNYSVRKLLKYSDEVLGLKSIQRKKEGGKRLKLSQLYRLLTDPFYAGFFYAKDESGRKTKYEVNKSISRMITEEQYWRIQTMLGRKGGPRPSKNKNTFPYGGRIKCGGCGGAVTAEHKHQLICPECKLKFWYPNKTHCPRCGIEIEKMENPKYLHYIYYHCNKRRDPNCLEKCIEENEIDDFMSGYLKENFKISSDLKDWSINHLDELEKSDKENEFERQLSWEKERDKKKKECNELIMMKARKEITEEEFAELKTALKNDIEQIEKNLTGNKDSSSHERVERVRRAFDMAVGLAEVFENSEYEEKIEALGELGSNLALKGKKLTFSTEKPYSMIIRGVIEAKRENPLFEPEKWKKMNGKKGKTGDFAPACPAWLRE